MKGLWFLLKYSWSHQKIYIIFSILNQFIQGGILIANLILPKFLIDGLIDHQPPERILFWIGMIVGNNAIGKITNNYFTGKCFVLKGKLFTDFQVDLTEKLSKCDFERLEDKNFLDTKERARKFLYANGQGFGVVMDRAFNIIGKVFVFAGIITILSTLSLALVGLFIVLILVNTKFEGTTRKNYVKLDLEKAPVERRTAYLLNLVEDFSFGKEIRIFGIRDWITEKVCHYLSESDCFYKKQVGEEMKAQYFAAAVNMILEVVSYITIGWKVIAGTIGIGDFSMYISTMASFTSAMTDVMQSILDMKQFSGYYDALEQYMNIPSTMYGGKLEAPESFHTLTFENVSFKYQGQDTYALRNISQEIRFGERIAIVGENGAGKSTFIKLVCRLYEPTEGRILLDGTDIRDYSYDSYMKLIGAVFQDFRLFSFSMRENLIFDRQGVSDSELIKLLEESGLGAKLEDIDYNLDRSIYKNFDETGFEPSGGEGQKIAIARAVFKNAPIVVLDEPTSAMDPRAEYELYQRFHKMVEGKTAFFISHRMSSTKFCDRIVVINRGRITEQGTHEELMWENGNYAELFRMQAQFYND